VVLAKEEFDEDRGLVAVPHAAHRGASGTDREGAAEGFAKVSEWEIDDHRYSERTVAPSALAGERRTLVGPMTAGIVGV
jgi:hypothetical protein